MQLMTSPLPLDAQQNMPAAWNSTYADYPREKCMHELFEQRAAETPEAIAVVCGSRQLNYRELNFRANQLANSLRKLGAGPDTLVGICMYRSVEMIVSILGTLKAGAAYVPLDPAYPQKRLASMMEDMELRVLLTNSDTQAVLPRTEVKKLFVDSDWSQIAEESGDNLPAQASVKNLCYVIFTSGSTGKAKAAAVFHGGWTNLMHWFVTEFQIGAADKVLVISSFSFDITQRSIVMPLIAGAQLHLLAANYYDPGLILHTIASEKITRMNCAPSTFYPLVENTREFFKLKSLRTLFLGGEAISATRIREWAGSPECGAEVANVYGAAECSDVSSFYILKDYKRYVENSVPIGKPIFNTQIYLLDESLHPVPFGETGEICIAGDGVGKGYINDAELTAKKFVANPYAADAPGLLYRTGDLARVAADGNLEFIGRVDHQVKLRGFRIELSDIESTLRQHREVKEAVVVSKSFSEQDQRLVAFVVPRHRGGSRDQTGSQLRTFLKERLPEYMVPNDVITLEEMPLSPNGKTDRNALLSMDIHALGTKAGLEEPRTPEERDLAAIFAKVLKLERVGILDNFFDLGGHSYLVTETLGCIADQFHVHLSIFDFLANPKVTDLLKRIEEVQREDAMNMAEPQIKSGAAI
jgi:amino acid adenylation domain-containing protein